MIKTKPINFNHPNFVKKSYLYRGVPPRIKIKKKIQKRNLIEKNKFELHTKCIAFAWISNKYGQIMSSGKKINKKTLIQSVQIKLKSV